jgi:oligosaccharide repeat unit polymerase
LCVNLYAHCGWACYRIINSYQHKISKKFMLFFVLSLLAVVMLFRHGSVLAPSVFVAGFWSAYALMTLIGFGWDSISIAASVIVFLAALMVALGDELGLQVKVTSKKNKVITNWYVWRLLTIVTLLGGIFHVFVVILFEGYSFSSLLTLDGLLEASHAMSWERYHGNYSSPFLAKISLPFVFMAPLLAGNLVGARGCDRRFRLFWAIACLISPLGIAAIKTEKWPLICCVTFYVASFISARHVVNKESVPLFRYGLMSLTAFVSLSAVTLVSCVLRLGRWSVDAFYIGWDKVLSCIGSLVVFSKWLDLNSFEFPMNWGASTFAGFFHLLGIAERKQGLYGTFLELPNGEYSNVYTVLRPLLEDFTIVGAMLGIFFIGFIWRIGIRNKQLVITAFFMSASVIAINTSIFCHNSLPIAFVAFAGATFLCNSSFRSCALNSQNNFSKNVDRSNRFNPDWQLNH